MGAGIDMAPGDIAFKCNFATLDTATKTVIKRRADRHFEDVGPELCASLDGAPLHITYQHPLLCKKFCECPSLNALCDACIKVPFQ